VDEVATELGIGAEQAWEMILPRPMSRPKRDTLVAGIVVTMAQLLSK
jgi:hypothetical protein